MPIEYRELTPDDDFSQCIQLQREVFGFSDVDVISPLFFKLLSQQFPPMGLTVGAFEKQGGETRIAGIVVSFATFLERSAYVVMYGVSPEYRDGTIAVRLLRAYREIALCKGFDRLYGVFEPLETNLSRLYVGLLGVRGIRYFPDPLGTLPGHDRLMFVWDFTENKGSRVSREGAPVASVDHFPDTPWVLIPMPGDWLELCEVAPNDASDWRRTTRALFNHYLNERNYTVEGCLSGKTEGGRAVHYLLKRSDADAQDRR